MGKKGDPRLPGLSMSPEQIVAAAVESNYQSIAYT